MANPPRIPPSVRPASAGPIPQAELVEADTILRRYSGRGELPWSSAAAIAFHVLLLLLLILFASRMVRPDPEPPKVDTIRIADADSSAPGDDGETGMTGDPGLEATSNEESSDAPSEIDAPEQVDDLKAETPQGKTVAAPNELIPDTKESRRKSRELADRAKRQLQDKVGRNMGGSGGDGGGGGSGATGRAARIARWILIFNMRNTRDYLAQLEGLDAAVAFPLSGDRFAYFTNLTSSTPTKKIQGLSSESRFYWTAEDSGAKAIARALGMSDSEFMVIFLPRKLEEDMAEMELSYANRAEEDIESTRFEVVQRGGRFSVVVASQTGR